MSSEFFQTHPARLHPGLTRTRRSSFGSNATSSDIVTPDRSYEEILRPITPEIAPRSHLTTQAPEKMFLPIVPRSRSVADDRVIEVTFPNKVKESLPYGICGRDILKNYSSHFPETKYPYIGVYVNNECLSPFTPITYNCDAVAFTMSNEFGAKVYRASLSFLFVAAAKMCCPDRSIVMGNAIFGHAFFFEISDGELNVTDLNRIRETMNELVRGDFDLVSRRIPLMQALEIFAERSSYKLLRYSADPLVHCHTLECPIASNLISERSEELQDTFKFVGMVHMAYVPSTGYLKVFEVVKHKKGALLIYPPASSPDRVVGSIEANPILFKIYEQHKLHGKILGVQSIGELIEMSFKNQISEYIRVAEHLLEKGIANIADSIYHRKSNLKVILIAGPSSSGKTTFCRKLQIQLKVLGMNPVAVSLDNYYLNREDIPEDSSGEKDLETIDALDVSLLNRHLKQLFDGETITPPKYDFKQGKRQWAKETFHLPESSIIMMEGIHGLNDKLTASIPVEKKFRIYISCLSQINVDDFNRISTTDNRLIRRMVRDYAHRGHSALQTLRMWPKVRAGEDKNIFPFQNDADVAFNSCLDYELGVLKVFASPLLRTVQPDVPEYAVARRLRHFMDNFVEVNPANVPSESILREFIGNDFVNSLNVH